MIGIVVVSHSRALAVAAVELAGQMVAAEARPTIAIAAGIGPAASGGSGGFGTDAAAVAEAILAADSPDGVLVLLDLGSAVLSAELACELLDRDVAARVRISGAPLVEGLVIAVVLAATGASLPDVAAQAARALEAKGAHLSAAPPGLV